MINTLVYYNKNYAKYLNNNKNHMCYIKTNLSAVLCEMLLLKK